MNEPKVIQKAQEKKQKQLIRDSIDEAFEELEFEQFLDDTASYILDLVDRIERLEEEVYD